jgi:hypothetical protein
MLNLNKPRPFFGSSVTQNTQSDHDHKLGLFTGSGLRSVKKDTVFTSEIISAPAPNIKYSRDFTREMPAEASMLRNNELPFKQVMVNKMRGNDKHLTGDFRNTMTSDVSRQNLPGMVPTGYSGVRKSASIGAVYNTRKHAKRVNDNLPGIMNFSKFKPTKISDDFRKTDKVTHYNVFEKNFSVNNNNKKQITPDEYLETNNTTARVNDRNNRSNVINKLGVTDHDHIRTSGRDLTHKNEELPANLSYPLKMRGTPLVEKSSKMYKVNTPVRKMAKFVKYEQYAGGNMSFKSKPSITSNYKTPGNRSFNWNNISPTVTVAGQSKFGIALSGSHELNKPVLDVSNTVSGNKQVYDMTDTWKHTIPEKILGIENINRTEA